MFKNDFKRRMCTGLAALALVAPLALGGFGAVHADTTIAPSTQTASQSQGSQSIATGGNTSSSNSNSNGNKKTITMQQFQAMIKKQQAAQKAQQAKMLKHAIPLFLEQGKEVYTVKVDLGKKGKATPVPGTQKKLMPLKRFERLQRTEINKAQRMFYRARRIRSTSKRKKAAAAAQALFLKYGRVAQEPTPQQQAAQEKKLAAQQQKRAKNQSRHGRSNRKTRSNRRNRRRSNSTRKTTRKPRQTSHQATSHVMENGDLVLSSEFRRGSVKAAKRTGFAQKSFPQSKVNAVFDRYAPNDNRAVIPSDYQIVPQETVWFPGQRYSSTIVDHMDSLKSAYYYNPGYQGWAAIGQGWVK